MLAKQCPSEGDITGQPPACLRPKSLGLPSEDRGPLREGHLRCGGGGRGGRTMAGQRNHRMHFNWPRSGRVAVASLGLSVLFCPMGAITESTCCARREDGLDEAPGLRMGSGSTRTSMRERGRKEQEFSKLVSLTVRIRSPWPILLLGLQEHRDNLSPVLMRKHTERGGYCLKSPST